MDIQRWLQATTDRAPPDRSDNVGIPDFINAQPAEREVDSRRYQRKRKKRASSDSSLITSNHSKDQTRERKRQRRSNYDSRDTTRVSERLLRRSRSSEGTLSDVPSKTYERRPRHKTKPDRYEPKTKRPRKERDAHAEKKAIWKRRRSHRNDGERTTGLVQSFQLKNGPKQNRLTLKHDAGAGLFKHGRASAQMTGRGNGLPDLVFNEMKFLRKPTEHQDEPAQNEAPKTDSKTNKQRLSNKEISAYFTTKDVVSDNAAQLADLPEELNEAKRRSQDLRQQQPSHRKPPSIELPDKPFLGFGSKGVHTGSARAHHDEDTEYPSWSESQPRQSKALNVLDEAPREQKTTDRRSQKQTRDTGRSSNHKKAPAKDEDYSDLENAYAGQWIPSRRARGQHLVEVCQPPAVRKRHKIRDDTSMTRTTMQSLPRLPPSDEQGGRNDTQQMAHLETLRRNYQTSDILDLRNSQRPPAAERQAVSIRQPLSNAFPSNKENSDPNSSLDRLLSEARKVTRHEGTPLVRSTKPDRERIREASVHRPDINFEEDHSRSHRVPFNQLNNQQRLIEPHRRPKVTEQVLDTRPQTGLRAYSVPRIPVHDHKVLRDRRGGQEYFTEQQSDDEMLDNEPDAREPYSPIRQIYANDYQAAMPATRAASFPQSGFLEAQTERFESESHGRSFMRDSVSRQTIPTHVSSVGCETFGGRIDQTLSDVDDLFAGFWKPNKLY